MKIANDEILYIKALESISGVGARDCIIGEKIISYLVDDKDVGRVVGKGGETVKKLRQRAKKNIEIFPYCKTAEDFVKKSLYGIVIDNVERVDRDGKTEMRITLNGENRRKLTSNLGRFKRVKEIAKRNYKINNIKIK